MIIFDYLTAIEEQEKRYLADFSRFDLTLTRKP
jgi:hypothetical protein